MKVTIATARFSTGPVEISPRANLELSEEDVFVALLRHISGDWGDLDQHDWKHNDEALEWDARLLSQYWSQEGTKFWIITEADRSATTVMLPEEY